MKVFTAIRKKNVLGSLGGRITQAEELKPGQESWVPAPSAGWQEALEGLFIHLKQGHRQKKKIKKLKIGTQIYSRWDENMMS